MKQTKNKPGFEIVVMYSDDDNGKDEKQINREIEEWIKHILNKYPSGLHSPKSGSM